MFLIPILLAASPVAAQLPRVGLRLVAERQFQAPVSIAGTPDGRLFVCEQRGAIRIFRNGVVLPRPFLDLGSKLVPERANFDERGLLGLAFHPQYAMSGMAGSGRFYVFYSAPSPAAPGTTENPVDCRSVIAEYRVSAADPDVADPASERILLAFDKPQFNHNGGHLEFGPDGFLHIATGDGGSSNDNAAGHTGGAPGSPAARPTDALGNSQDLRRLLGKILRIDPLGRNSDSGQYGIPGSNPFAFAFDGERPEIWAYGLRNPWRFSFDTGPGSTGRLFAADVGQGEIEEVDLIVRGGNFGWRNREGTFAPDFSLGAPDPGVPLIDPIAQYAHPGVVKGSPPLPQYGTSITGGHVYRGSALAALRGVYVFGDWSLTGTTPGAMLLGLQEGPGGTWTMSPLDVEGGNPIPWFIQAFGRDAAGELYIAVKKTRAVSDPDNGLPAGGLLKIVPASGPRTTLLGAAADTTLYSEGARANGGGQQLFAGKVEEQGGGALRRALIRFDLSSIPAGAQVQSVQLTLNMNRSIVGDRAVALHRVSESWAEGTATATGQEGTGAAAQSGDPTWLNRSHPSQAWSVPGGAFVPDASAVRSVGISSGPVTWSGAGMVADVQSWVNQPAGNLGWLLLADESQVSAKRFSSRQHADSAQRPALSVTWAPAPPPAPTRREEWEAANFFAGQFIDPAADPDGDGIPNLVEYAGDTLAGSAASGPESLRVVREGATVVAIFRRDPRATDLTVTLESSSALSGWQPLATSTAGAAASGSGVTEAPAARPPLVEVRVPLPTGAARHVRLRATR